MAVLTKLFDHYRAMTDGYYLKLWFYKASLEIKLTDRSTKLNFGDFMFMTDSKTLAWCYEDKIFPVYISQYKDGVGWTYDGVIEGDDASNVKLGSRTFYFNCDEETISNWLTELQKRFERDEWLSVERMKKITEFQNIMAEINCDIILNNLRNLHAELQSAYLSYKMEQDQKSKKEKKE